MLAVEESASLPQAKTVAPGAESTPLEATVVEGKWAVMVSSALCSSHSPRVLISCGLCLTGTQVEGGAIPEAVP
jgi:hypothetical protein